MIPQDCRQKKAATTLRRVAALSVGVVLGSTALPAMATPADWADPDNPSFLGALLQIGGPVIAIIAVLALLTYLPSMMGRGGSSAPTYNDPEWFGGPRAGIDEQVEGSQDAGGSGGRW